MKKKKNFNDNDLFLILKANDMFSLGCIITEIFLEKPLFNPKSMLQYYQDQILPSHLKKVIYLIFYILYF